MDARYPLRAGAVAGARWGHRPAQSGACLRVADAVGAQAVIAPKDRSAGLNATAMKVASGAADTGSVCDGDQSRTQPARDGRLAYGPSAPAGEAEKSIYAIDQKGPVAWVLGAEGEGLRRLYPRNLRRTGANPDVWHGRESQCLGRQRVLPVRGTPAAERLDGAAPRGAALRVPVLPPRTAGCPARRSSNDRRTRAKTGPGSAGSIAYATSIGGGRSDFVATQNGRASPSALGTHNPDPTSRHANLRNTL